MDIVFVSSFADLGRLKSDPVTVPRVQRGGEKIASTTNAVQRQFSSVIEKT
jgi:hypothetical protein